MTKDEYLYALASVKIDGDYCDEKKYSILQKLIEEHFDNLPLKFEELEAGMWVWDDKEKWYRKIVILFNPCQEYPKGSFKSYADSREINGILERLPGWSKAPNPIRINKEYGKQRAYKRDNG